MCRSHIRLLLLAAISLTGCKPANDNSLPSSFSPPGIGSLADIDTAKVPYEDECVVIQGVVSPDSQSGWPREDDAYKVHFFSLIAWRRIGEPLVRQDLKILRAVPADADFWDDFPEYSIHRMSVLLSTDGRRAVFQKALPLDSPDEELLAVVEELRKPVVVSTKRFGDLVLDRSIGWFEGQAEWGGKTVSLSFPGAEEESLDDAIKTAESLFSNEANWRERIESYAVKELLDLKNDTWLQEGESKLSAEQFISRMTLNSISILPDGGFEFWYDDGDLFWGHSIMVSGNVKGDLTDAGIHG